MRKTSVKKISIAGLALTVTSALVSAIIPLEKGNNDMLVNNGTLTAKIANCFALVSRTCTTRDAGDPQANCTATDSDGDQSTTTGAGQCTSNDLTDPNNSNNNTSWELN